MCFHGTTQGMPDDIAGGYDAVGDMWVSSEDSDTEIKAGCGVRLRIIGVTVGAELVRKSLEQSSVFFRLPAAKKGLKGPDGVIFCGDRFFFKLCVIYKNKKNHGETGIFRCFV